MNYAQQVQHEANQLARRKLARAFDAAELDAVLEALEVIHAQRMAEAAELVAPNLLRGKHSPMTIEMAGPEVIYPVALGLMKAATELAFEARKETEHV